MKKTLTLGFNDNPTVSLCLGHVTATEFNKAFFAEGWRGGGWIHKSELRHEYWKKLKRSWRKSTISDKHAVAVTVSDW